MPRHDEDATPRTLPTGGPIKGPKDLESHDGVLRPTGETLPEGAARPPRRPK